MPAGNPQPLPGPLAVLYDTATQRVLSLGASSDLDVVTDAFSAKVITAHENVDALHMVRTFTLDRSKGTFVLKPANKAYPVIRPRGRLEIFGVMAGLVRRAR